VLPISRKIVYFLYVEPNELGNLLDNEGARHVLLAWIHQALVRSMSMTISVMTMVMIPGVLPTLSWFRKDHKCVYHFRENEELVQNAYRGRGKQKMRRNIQAVAWTNEHVRQIISCPMKDPEPHYHAKAVPNSYVCSTRHRRFETSIGLPRLRIPLSRSCHDENSES
jgi:hypothetical protein